MNDELRWEADPDGWTLVFGEHRSVAFFVNGDNPTGFGTVTATSPTIALDIQRSHNDDPGSYEEAVETVKFLVGAFMERGRQIREGQ